MSLGLVNSLIMLALGLAAMSYLFLFPKRSVRAVLEDIATEREQDRDSKNDLAWHFDRAGGRDQSTQDKKRPVKNGLNRTHLIRVSFGLILAFACYLSGRATPPTLIMSFVVGACLCYLFENKRLRNKELRYNRSIDFYLPIVMERISMAVQSGLDIISGIKAVIELDRLEGAEQVAHGSQNPVTDLLKTVIDQTEGGLGFSQSLRDVAKKVQSTGLKHSFIHLGLAHQEGGELAVPLRELSDATQLYYQETIEEEIARLPVKATMPLLLTFAGLIICFITSPMIQILHMTDSAMLGH